MAWKPASEPPEIPDGTMVHVIVAVRGRGADGKLKTGGAMYANNYEVNKDLVEDGDEAGVWSGFVDEFKHDYYDEWYELIDNVVFWHPMIEPPE